MGTSLPEYDITQDDDVEAQRQQHSRWLFKVEQILRVKEKVQCPFSFQILKVPEFFRQPSEEFTPQGWRLGLHNRENLDTSGNGFEALKMSIAESFGLVGEEWLRFCDIIVPDPQKMLVCYGLHEEVSTMDYVVIKQMLALDALFLVVRVDSLTGGSNLKPLYNDMLLRRYNRWGNLIFLDLCKIENQIPLTLIDRTIGYLKNPADPQYHEDEDHPVSSANGRQVPDPYTEEWIECAANKGINSFMDISYDFYEIEKAYPSLSTSDHILDASYKAICGEKGMRRSSDYSVTNYIYNPSATKMRDSGIKIVGIAGPLCIMSYEKEKKCLYLPKMKMMDETMAIVRNMARYEEYYSDDKCTFHDYVFFMLHLIETPEDYKFLTKCEVIHNACGNKGFETWKALDHGLVLTHSSKEHNQMKKDIITRCEVNWYRYWREFQVLFLSRPWLTLSAFAVVLVTVATLIQTYAAVIGSNGMKPQFRP